MRFQVHRRGGFTLLELAIAVVLLVLLMMLAVLMLCFMPQISTWLPDLVMGPDGGR